MKKKKKTPKKSTKCSSGRKTSSTKSTMKPFKAGKDL
jgi:hypothetical protein